MRIATLEDLSQKRNANVTHLGTIHPEETYVAKRPISLTGQLASADEKHLIPLVSEEFEVRAPALDIFSVTDALVLPNAAICTGDHIIADSLRPYLHREDVLAQFGKRILPIADSQDEYDIRVSNLRRIAKPSLLVRDHGEAGYFHFLHSVLPRVLLWQQCPVPDLHIARTTSFQTQFLDYLRVSKERLQVAAGQAYLYDQAYMISGLVRPDWTTGGFFERPLEVTRRLRSLIPADAAYSGERIYISRRDSPIRPVKNESAFEGILAQQYGFKSVVLSEMTPDQQIRTFASAAIVVGSHGAGLSNASFMKEGAILFEIFPRSRIWPTFRAIATRANLRYATHVSPAADQFDIEDLAPAIGRVLNAA
jgi:capsular polysaccharide biosynthesis protein